MHGKFLNVTREVHKIVFNSIFTGQTWTMVMICLILQANEIEKRKAVPEDSVY